MIQRGIGVTLGAVVTLILLVILGPSDATADQYIAPLVIGAIVAFAWPILIVFWLGRRAKARRKGQIDDEITRQVNEQTKG